MKKVSYIVCILALYIWLMENKTTFFCFRPSLNDLVLMLKRLCILFLHIFVSYYCVYYLCQHLLYSDSPMRTVFDCLLRVSLFPSQCMCLSPMSSPLLWINGFPQPNPAYWHFGVTEHWSGNSHPPACQFEKSSSYYSYSVMFHTCIIIIGKLSVTVTWVLLAYLKISTSLVLQGFLDWWISSMLIFFCSFQCILPRQPFIVMALRVVR